jgi:(p)ppGpp synthase/HD superfamily hydrolase
MLDEARAFAVAAHDTQRYGDLPYSYHLDQVAALLLPFGSTAQVIGYLHDVVEDTDIKLSDIELRFGSFVAQCVDLLTDSSGSSRAERKAKTYQRLSEVVGSAELALIVKTADRLANVRACIADGNQRLLSMYLAEHVAFRSSAYRENLCENLWLELNSLLPVT